MIYKLTVLPMGFACGTRLKFLELCVRETYTLVTYDYLSNQSLYSRVKTKFIKKYQAQALVYQNWFLRSQNRNHLQPAKYGD